jgi:microcystin-dependent protein
MTTPFLGEVKMTSFNFAPKGWALCNGQALPINQNQALFAILGTTYGGNGQTTFNLPDLRGRVPMHMGSGFSLGQRGGEEAHTVTQSEMAQHIHQFFGDDQTAGAAVATNNLLAVAAASIYGAPTNLTTLRPDTVTNTGGSQPHTNLQPYLVISFCIALQGIFPSQT